VLDELVAKNQQGRLGEATSEAADALQRQQKRDRLRDGLAACFNLPTDRVEELLLTAERNIDSDLLLLHQAASDGDAVRLRNAAHSLKGLLLNLRLNEAAELAKKLQDAADDGALEDAGPLLAQLQQALAESFPPR
jgi:HPt (histidine-containing phosphotransfer) domain-containing protein